MSQPTPSMPDDFPATGWRPWACAFATVLVPCLILIHQIPLGWDEGFTLERQELVGQWMARLFDPSDSRPSPFSPQVLSHYWRFSREEPYGHGPVYGLLPWMSQLPSSWLLSPPASYRFGSALLYAGTIATVYSTLRRRFEPWTCAVGCSLLASLPRVLPEVSFALVDGPLYCFAILAWCGFTRSIEPGRHRLAFVGFGVALGLAMATKLTGWFLVFPYLAWSTWQRSRAGWRSLFVGGIVAGWTVLALNVGWWPDPVGGLIGFFRSNLTRAETIAIPIQFAGARYLFSLPWYNTLLWTAIAVPVGTLFLGLVGIACSIARFRTRPADMLLVFNWGLLMVIRALPQAPGHDGTRQIIISFGFLAILSAIGFDAVARWMRSHWNGRIANAALAGLSLLVVGESVGSAARYHPMQLSYYSPLIGGLPGAARLGFEPTYFWDAVTPDVLDWINANTAPGRCVLFRNQHRSWDFLARWGKLTADRCQEPTDFPRAQWLVMQHRPGIFTAGDAWILAHETPVFEKRLFGVPLISIYPAERFFEANRRFTDNPPTGEAP